MKKSLYLSIFILLQITAKTVIESDYSQFYVPHGISCGPTTCTPTYLQAASYILNDFNIYEMNQKNLETILSDGSRIFGLAGKGSTKNIINKEILIYIPEIKLDSALTGATTLPLSKGALSTYDIYGILSQKNPVCSLYIRQEKSYLICHKNNHWIFMDIHKKQNGTDGSHIIIFKNDKEFLTFIDENKIFKPSNSGSDADQFELYLYKSTHK
jgi:hypothetical protein